MPRRAPIPIQGPLRHGVFSQRALLPGEDASAFDLLRSRYLEHFGSAAGPVTDLVDELAKTSWRLARLDQAGAVLSEIRFREYLDGGESGSTESATSDPHAPGRRYREIDHEIQQGQEQLELDREFLGELKTIQNQHGPEEAAKAIAFWVSSQRTAPAPNGRPPLWKGHPVADDMPEDWEDPAQYVVSFQREMKKHARRERRRFGPLRDERDALREQLAAVFHSGVGDVLDRLPPNRRLEEERGRLLRRYDKLVITLARVRALGVAEEEVAGAAQLRAVP